jgi:uncharacterized protein YkwD
MGFLSKLNPRNWWGKWGHRPPVLPTSPGPVAPAPPPVGPSPPTKPVPPPVGPEAPWYAALLSLHNQYRAQHRLPPLQPNTSLMRSASLYAQSLASSGRLDHFLNGSNPGSRMSAQGYAWSREGENIAAGQTTPQQVMNDWMSDMGHRQNILGPYQDVGFGQVGNFWVVDFAAPLTSSHLPPVPHVKVVPAATTAVTWHPGGIDRRGTDE